ncbi:non-ribosomal peptide synthetase [Paenibacillus glucanolyticus]|uniref:non-ribosomal peptide synthetase n=1 Tax=Paenibacillus glucanolyticus TaxID=59843 RepID=UPI0034CE0E9A
MGTLISNKTLHQEFKSQAKKTPHKIAIKIDNDSMTYKELDSKSDFLASYLRSRGVKTDVIVGLMSVRSLEMIIGILAIMKAGGVYLPLDGDYPTDRITYMIRNSGMKYILCQSDFENNISGIEKIALDQLDELPPFSEGEHIEYSSRDLAYVIYTSGSTGNPKGVMVEHKSILNTLAWRKSYYSFGEQDVVLQLPSISFDSSIEDIFTALISGASLILLNNAQKLNIKFIEQLITDEKVTHFLTVPSFYKILLTEIHTNLSNLRAITIAGEQFGLHLVEDHYKKLPHVKLYNEYGPAENSVCSSCCLISPDTNEISIGKPITNAEMYILDENLQQVLRGEEGELYLSGVGLARGYINNPIETAHRFIQNPINKNQVLYRSGDIAKVNDDGEFIYLGRRDQQVKIRGMRVELQEIEAEIIRSGQVKDAVVCIKENTSGNKILCAYLNAFNGELQKLKMILQDKLPDFMVPQYFEVIDSIPLSLNGKIDYSQLPFLESSFLSINEEQDTYQSDRVKLIKIIHKVIGSHKNIGDDECTLDIKELGVDSLSFITLLVNIEDEFNFEFDYNFMNYKSVSINDILAIIESNRNE